MLRPHLSTFTQCCRSNTYLWVGTKGGLARFDGRRFTLFNSATTPAFRQDSVLCLEEGPDGTLWVGTSDGLLRYANLEWTCFDFPGVVHRWHHVWALAATRHQTVWIGTEGEGFYLWRNGNLEPMLDQHSLPSGPLPKVRALRVDDQGGLWLTGSSGLLRQNPETNTFQCLDRMGGLTLVQDGSAWWFSGGVDIHRWQDGKLKTWQTPSSIFPGHVTPIARRSGGGVWIASEAHGLGWSEGDEVSWVPIPEVPLRDATALLEDFEGNLWIGNGVAGLFQLRPRTLVTLTSAEGLAHDDVWSISPGINGTVWIGTPKGLCAWQGNRMEVFRDLSGGVLDQEMNNSIGLVCSDRNSRVWFGSHNGFLYHLISNRFEHAVTTNVPTGRKAPNAIPTASSIQEGASGTLWVGTIEGLYFLRRGYWDYLGGENGLRHIGVLGAVEDAAGDVWLGGPEGQVQRLRFDPHSERLAPTLQVRAFTGDPALPNTKIAPVMAESDGAVWFASGSGLIRWKNGRFMRLTTANGLHEDIVGGILKDDFGYLWLHGHRGIQRLNKAEVIEAFEGRRTRVEPLVFGQAEGMLSAECNVGSLPGSCRTPDGRLWFPTTRGVVVIDPRALKRNDVPPPVTIEQVVADREVIYGDFPVVRSAAAPQGVGEATPLRLAPGRARSLVIRYTANSFAAPERVRFHYRLEGHDQAWQEDNSNLRTAFYTNLRPGTYRFVVRAFNNHGVPSTGDATFAFMLAPHFYETLLFYLLCTATVLLAGASLHHSRMSGLRRIKQLEQQHALEVERARIARDMHDGLGTDLTKIALLADMAASMPFESASPDPMRRVSTIARGLVDGISELVWATNPRHDTVEGLAAYLRQYSSELLEPTKLRCQFEYSSSPEPLSISGETRRHLFLGVKEALNNAIKYSQATIITLTLSATAEEVRVSVSDNGCGFVLPHTGYPESNPEASRSGHGNGLANLCHRMAVLGGRCDIESAPGQGVRITLTAPRHRISAPEACPGRRA